MENITVDEVKKRRDAGEQLHLVDVREPHEHADFNIGGTLLPLGRVQTMQIEELEDLKNDEIIFYCRTGNRSGQACLILDMMGFKKTRNLAGGIVEWEGKFGRNQ